MWIKPLFWTKLFPKVKLIPSPKLNYFKVIKSMWYGTPNETQSDECLVKIAYSGSNKKCQIPETCIEILIRNDDTTGYPLTHRLLIIQIARMVNHKIKMLLERIYNTFQTLKLTLIFLIILFI